MRYTPIRKAHAAEQDGVDLIAYVAELEREVVNARRYLETCRELVGAERDEMLLDALRRQKSQRPARGPVDRGATDRRC